MISLVAHSGGFSWDEALLFASPVVVLIVLQIIGRRRARADDPTEQDGADRGEDT